MPAPRFQLQELAARFGARFGAECIGPGTVEIHRVATLREADANAIACYHRADYERDLRVTRAGAVILAPEDSSRTNRPCLTSREPYLLFAQIAQLLHPNPDPDPGVHPSAQIDPSARIDPTASVGPNVYIGARTVVGPKSVVAAGSRIGPDCKIGESSWIHMGVTLYAGTQLDARVIVHSGAVLGADGFGFANDQGRWVKIPQIGRVIVHADVEIGANTTIDRGALEDTILEEGVKLDNQIQIGHNCRIGAHTAVAGCAGIAGSTSIGKHCMIGGAAMIGGHLTIVDRVIVAGGTAISRSISTPGTYGGLFPFDDQKRWVRTAVHLRNISTLVDRVKALEQELARLRGELK